jgi:ComF family protein
MGSENIVGVYPWSKKIMNLLSLLKDIFLEKYERSDRIPSPKNLTYHYSVELRHVDFDEVCVWDEYAHLEKKIERYKYSSDRYISTELVEVLEKCVEVSVLFGEHDDWGIVPIPMHWSRYILRGFDHTSLLAEKFGEVVELSFIPLLKTKYRPRQSNLSRAKRVKNKKNSFFIKNKYTLPSHIILIDDVVSSGSTFQEAAKILKPAGAKVVICFAIASNAK